VGHRQGLALLSGAAARLVKPRSNPGQTAASPVGGCSHCHRQHRQLAVDDGGIYVGLKHHRGDGGGGAVKGDRASCCCCGGLGKGAGCNQQRVGGRCPALVLQWAASPTLLVSTWCVELLGAHGARCLQDAAAAAALSACGWSSSGADHTSPSGGPHSGDARPATAMMATQRCALHHSSVLLSAYSPFKRAGWMKLPLIDCTLLNTCSLNSICNQQSFLNQLNLKTQPAVFLCDLIRPGRDCLKNPSAPFQIPATLSSGRWCTDKTTKRRGRTMLSAALQRSRWALLRVLQQSGGAGVFVTTEGAAAATQPACFSSSADHSHQKPKPPPLPPSSSAPPLYAVLGIERTASAREVKTAFRRKAKLVHPDATRSQRANNSTAATNSSSSSSSMSNPEQHIESEKQAAAAFLQIVEAYEVLSNPSRRAMYDASIDSNLPGVIRSAASSNWQHGGGSSSSSSAAENAGGPGWRYGFDAWARDGPAAGSATVRRGGRDAAGYYAPRSVFDALERYRDLLEVDLHSALLHAFFGPK